MASLSFSNELQSDKQTIDGFLHSLLSGSNSHPASSVRAAMCYAVLGQAQRVRPVLALAVARMLGTSSSSVLPAAASVELLHCASLIIDDLPCMDDEKWRRDRATVHIAFGESTAVLAAFALVALAARTVIEPRNSGARTREQLEFQLALLQTLDCGSLIDGQALDLAMTHRVRRAVSSQSIESQRRHVIELKTVPLFELAVKAGMLYARPSTDEVAALRQFAREFGIAFQLIDDYLDDGYGGMHGLELQFQRARACLSPYFPERNEIEAILEYLHAKACHKNYSNR